METWGRARAELSIRGLEQRFSVLADNPLSGIAREDLQPEALRTVVHGSHAVFYRPQPYGVLIVRVLHGRQDVRTHLGSSEEP
jgi:toxin ParE1/3/4